jgi:hypothetical protein
MPVRVAEANAATLAMPEVGDLHLTGVGQQQIVRADVAMDDPQRLSTILSSVA